MDPDAPTPTLSRARSGGGWRLPLVALVVVVVGIVGMTRLGAPDPAAVLTPTRDTVMPNPFVPPPMPTLAPVVQVPGVMPRSPDGSTYADGIPTTISSKQVFRVRDALTGPVGRTLLVGGWYHQPHCAGRPRAMITCSAATMSDVPLVEGQGDVRTSFIALDSELADVGAYVVLAMIVDDPGCSIRDLGACQPRLQVIAEMWSGVG
jgi:hypothetical protein